MSHLPKFLMSTVYFIYSIKSGVCQFIQHLMLDKGCCCHKTLKAPPFVSGTIFALKPSQKLYPYHNPNLSQTPPPQHNEQLSSQQMIVIPAKASDPELTSKMSLHANILPPPPPKPTQQWFRGANGYSQNSSEPTIVAAQNNTNPPNSIGYFRPNHCGRKSNHPQNCKSPQIITLSDLYALSDKQLKLNNLEMS